MLHNVFTKALVIIGRALAARARPRDDPAPLRSAVIDGSTPTSKASARPRCSPRSATVSDKKRGPLWGPFFLRGSRGRSLQLGVQAQYACNPGLQSTPCRRLGIGRKTFLAVAPGHCPVLQ